MKNIFLTLFLLQLSSLAFNQSTSKPTIKSYFVKGAIPTQNQFSLFIDNSYNEVTSNILQGSGYPTILYQPWTTPGIGRIYTGTINPSSTFRSNYDGYWYATKLFSNGYQTLTVNDTTDKVATKKDVSNNTSTWPTDSILYASKSFTLKAVNDTAQAIRASVDNLYPIRFEGSIYSGLYVAQGDGSTPASSALSVGDGSINKYYDLLLTTNDYMKLYASDEKGDATAWFDGAGLRYYQNYGARFTTRSLIDRNYVDSLFTISTTTLTDDILQADNTLKTFKLHDTKPAGTGVYLYSGTSAPTGTVRANLNGIFYATRLIGYGASNIIAVSGSGSGSTGIGVYGYTNSAIGVKAEVLGSEGGALATALQVSNTSSLASDITTGALVNIIDNPTLNGYISSHSLIKGTIGSTVRLDLNPRVVSGSTAVAYTFDTQNTLSTTGAKHTVFKNAGTEIVSIDKDGAIICGTLTPGHIHIPMGELSYFNITGTTITISAQSDGFTNMVKVNPTSIFTSDPLPMDFDNGGSDNGRLRYTGSVTRHFHVACTISFSGASPNQNAVFGIAKNGIVVNSSKVIPFLGLGTDTRSTALHVEVELTTNDYLELYVGNITASNNIIIKTFNLFAMGM